MVMRRLLNATERGDADLLAVAGSDSVGMSIDA
jgi:hypothetical protein